MAQNKINKLELTWIGKDEEPLAVESRLLIETPKHSFGEVETSKYNGIVEVIYDIANSDVVIRNMNKGDIDQVMVICRDMMYSESYALIMLIFSYM